MVSYLSEKTLEIFWDMGWIGEDIYVKSKELREQYFDIEKNKRLLNAEAVRTAEEWKKFFYCRMK